ncbi:MAG: ABC transporter substrate-binding protein [Oscillospiraceae bacterium]|nr:ABC transporter substrate-binding protein [Oscillospiraceae bacterium]
MKKLVVLVVLCLFAVLFVAACNGGTEDVPPPVDEGTLETPTPEVVDEDTSTDDFEDVVVPEEPMEDVSVNVILVDGAPGLAMAYMMSDEFVGIDGFDISYTMTNDVDALVASLLNQEPDFAIAPINIAAMMHTNGSGYRLAAITTWGLMHLVSDQDISSLEELKGETVVAFARAGTPGITLRSVLAQNDIPFIEPDTTDFTPDPDSVAIIYLTAPSDVRDAVATGMEIGGTPVSFAVLAEPVATAITGFAANMGREGFTARINLQDEWARNNDGEIYPQVALIFHERLLDSDTDFVQDFISAVEQSTNFVMTNPVEAGDLLVELGSVAIPNGQVVGNAVGARRIPMDFTRATAARSAVEAFLQVLFDENPNLIGGAMPSDEFFFGG